MDIVFIYFVLYFLFYFFKKIHPFNLFRTFLGVYNFLRGEEDEAKRKAKEKRRANQIWKINSSTTIVKFNSIHCIIDNNNNANTILRACPLDSIIYENYQKVKESVKWW